MACDSSGTRIHEYELSSADGFNEIKVTVKGSDQVSDGLSHYIDDGSSADDEHGVNSEALMANVNDLLKRWLSNSNIKSTIAANTPVYVYATPGYRYVRYGAVSDALGITAKAIQKSLGSTSIKTAVISGNDKAFFDWVGINTHNLESDQTQGLLDLSNRSVGMAFNDDKDENSSYQFNFNNYHYNVIAYDLEDAGENHVMALVNGTEPNGRSVCYPAGVWSADVTSGHTLGYSFSGCSSNTGNVLELITDTYSFNHIMELEIDLNLKNLKWQTIGNVYKTAQYFGANSMNDLKVNAANYNGQSWQEVKDEESKKTDPASLRLLQKFDAEAAYDDSVFRTYFDAQAFPNISFSNDADWTAGVAFNGFYHLLVPKDLA